MCPGQALCCVFASGSQGKGWGGGGRGWGRVPSFAQRPRHLTRVPTLRGTPLLTARAVSVDCLGTPCSAGFLEEAPE